MEEINKELLEILKSIFEDLVGAWDDVVITEELYERMENAINKAENML